MRNIAGRAIGIMDKPSGTIVVRRFEPADAEAVADMMRDLAAHHGEHASATAADFVAHAVGPDRISDVSVALLKGNLCGFAATYDWMNYVQGFPVKHIDLFFVRETARRRGIGHALLRHIASEAKAARCRRVTVGAEPDNAGANAFYLNMGFERRDPGSNRYVVSGSAVDRLTIP